MILASIESFLGSLWFAGLMTLTGYIGGCIFPITKIKEMISK